MKWGNAQVVFLQGKHLTSSEHKKLKRMGFSVAILILQKIKFEHLSEVADKEGRCIIVSGKTDGVVITLCNICAPLEVILLFTERYLIS